MCIIHRLLISDRKNAELMNKTAEKITLYTSRWCGHSRSVEGFLKRNDIDVDIINIDGDDEARQHLIELNGGYASVPTLLFPDGSKLTEPTLYQIREQLGLEHPPGLTDRVRALLSRSKDK